MINAVLNISELNTEFNIAKFNMSMYSNVVCFVTDSHVTGKGGGGRLEHPSFEWTQAKWKLL